MVLYAHGVLCQGYHKFGAKCGMPSSAWRLYHTTAGSAPQLELLALLVNGVTSLAYRRPQVGDVMKAQVLWDLVLGILPACELACTHRSGSSPCPHLVTAASTSPQLAVARPCHRRPHARAPSKLPRGAAEQLHDLLIRNVVWVRADNH